MEVNSQLEHKLIEKKVNKITKMLNELIEIVEGHLRDISQWSCIEMTQNILIEYYELFSLFYDIEKVKSSLTIFSLVKLTKRLYKYIIQIFIFEYSVNRIDYYNKKNSWYISRVRCGLQFWFELYKSYMSTYEHDYFLIELENLDDEINMSDCLSNDHKKIVTKLLSTYSKKIFYNSIDTNKVNNKLIDAIIDLPLNKRRNNSLADSIVDFPIKNKQ